MDFAGDVAHMLSDFGVNATVGGNTVVGLFDEPYADAIGIAGSQPTFLVQSAETIGMHTPITIEGVSYIVRGIMHDGNDLTRLVLEAA